MKRRILTLILTVFTLLALTSLATAVTPFDYSNSSLVASGYLSETTAAQSLQPIWGPGGTIAEPTVAAAISCQSNSTLDTSSGTGARTLFIRGLDATYTEISKTITLSGKTPVTSGTTLFYRVNSGYVASYGSYGHNMGDILCESGGEKIFFMEAGANFSNIPYYTVPKNKTFKITDITLTSPDSPSLMIFLAFKPYGFDWQVLTGWWFISQFNIIFPTSLVFQPKTTVALWYYASASTDAVSATGAWTGVLQ